MYAYKLNTFQRLSLERLHIIPFAPFYIFAVCGVGGNNPFTSTLQSTF